MTQPTVPIFDDFDALPDPGEGLAVDGAPELLAQYVDLEDSHAYRARYDPAAFAAYVMRDEETNRPIKLSAIHNEWHDLASTHKRVLVWAHVEAGKAVPLDTEIPTPSGWTTMGALKPGDVVFGGDGKPCRVLATSAVQTDRRLYEIEFMDGAVVRADADHNWLVWGETRRRWNKPGQILTTEQIAAKVTRGSHCGWHVPATRAVLYSEKGLAVAPFELGGWLARGVEGCHWEAQFHRALGAVPGEIPERRIPAAYLQASVPQRERLLRGLLGPKGNRGTKKNPTSRGLLWVTVETEALCRDVLELARSLGFIAKLYPPTPDSPYVAPRKWRVSFRCDRAVPWPHLVERAYTDVETPRRLRKYPKRAIRRVTEIPSVPVKCISVNSVDHTYIMDRSYTVTHNTQQLAIARVLWELGHNPNIRVVIISNTSGQATKTTMTIAKYIERSPEYHRVFPGVRRDKTMPWNQGALYIERDTKAKDPSVQVCGVHSNILGSRIDLLIIDDILDYELSVSPHQREGLRSWFKATMEGRMTRKGRMICVGTAWNKDDLMHEFAARSDWYAVRYSVLNDDGTATWPDRWPAERIAEKRISLGPVEYNRQLLCVARSDEESRFKREWVDKCLELGDGRKPTHALESVPGGYQTITGVDLSVGGKGGDLTCLFTIIIHPDETREVLEVQSGRWGGPEIVNRIIDTHYRFHSIVIVENNACFVPGTRVLTPRGYLPIEAIVVGDEVWTHRGRWRRVTELHSGYATTVTTARAKGSLPVTTTPNHWFYMRPAGRTPGRGGGHHRPMGEAEWISYGVRDLPAYAALAAPKWPEAPPELRLVASVREPEKIVAVDESLALLLGLYMADGHTTVGQVCWTFGADDDYLVDLVRDTVARLTDRKVSTTVFGNTTRVTVNSTRLARTFRPYGKFATKCLPIEWLGWPLELRLALVRGWLLGDGCTTRNNVRSGSVSWTLGGCTISRDWLLFVRATLLDAGLTPMTSRRAPSMGHIEKRVVQQKELFAIKLSWRDSRALRDRMTTHAEHLRWDYWWRNDVGEPKRGQGHIHDAGHVWARVPEIEESPFHEHNGKVYNLTVEEDESYTVEDFIVHNSQEFIVQFTKKLSAVPVRSYTTGKNITHPQFGLEALATEMANSKWIIPGRKRDGVWMGANAEIQGWIQEMLYYDPNAHAGDRLMACVTPGHTVTTTRGLVPIEDVSTGDVVLTHLGRWREVTGVESRRYTGDVVVVKPRGLAGVTMTPEHPVWAANATYERVPRTNRIIPGKWAWLDAGGLRAGSLKSGDYVLSPSVQQWPFTPPSVDDETAFLVGLYLAEGWRADHQIAFGLHERETYLVEFIRRVALRLWGASTSVYTRPGEHGITAVVNSRKATEFFAEFGKHKTIALPWEWMGVSTHTGLLIVRGWLVGDGSVSKAPSGTEGLKAVSISPTLIRQMQHFLWAAGMTPSVGPFKQSGMFQGVPCNQSPAWRMALPSSDTARLLREILPEEELRWGVARNWVERDRTNAGATVCRDGVASKLASVERRSYSGVVYNLHVEEDESFVVGGIAVHNCWFAREGARQVRPKLQQGRIHTHIQ